MRTGFHPAYSLGGHKAMQEVELYVPAATALEKGEPHSFTQGTGVIVLAGPTDFNDPVVGVILEPHGGSGSYTGRQAGTKVKSCIDPHMVYKYRASKTYTLTDGGTNYATDDSLLPQTNDFWNGGCIEIVSCAADSNLNGKIVAISDSTGASGKLDLAETLPSALAAADTIRLCPGPMARFYHGWDLSADAMHPDFDTDAGESLILVDTSPKEMMMFFMFRLHEMAGHVAAI
jgi:hypothetical protein